jgi:uncharacterized protein YjiS (DUF1127 family)
MSTCTHPSMTNLHASTGSAAHGLLARVGDVLQIWRERHVQRTELALWAERDIRDAGYSRGEVLFEASKPFWRA